MSQRCIKFTNHLHVVPHLTEGEYLSTQGAFNMLPSEFGGPLENVYRTREGGGHQANNVSQSTTSILCIGSKSRIRPAHQHHGALMNRRGLSPVFVRILERSSGARGQPKVILQNIVTLPSLHFLDQIIDPIQINDLKTVEVGREACQAGANVRSGRRCQPTKLSQLALTDLELFVIKRSIAVLP